MIVNADLAGSRADVGEKQVFVVESKVRGNDRLNGQIAETRFIHSGEDLDIDSRKKFDPFNENVCIECFPDRTGGNCLVGFDLVFMKFQFEFLHDFAEHPYRIVADATGFENVCAERNGNFKIFQRFVGSAAFVDFNDQETGGMGSDVDGSEKLLHFRSVPLARMVAPTATAWSPRREIRTSMSLGEIPNRWR